LRLEIENQFIESHPGLGVHYGIVNQDREFAVVMVDPDGRALLDLLNPDI
jgi:hypothetical protein